MTAPRYDPFATDILQLQIGDSAGGVNRSHLIVRPARINSIGVLPGGVTFSLVDESMGAAMESSLTPEEASSTLEIKINDLEPILEGRIDCETRVIRRGGRIAVLEADVQHQDQLAAKALGACALIRRAQIPQAASAQSASP